MMWYIRSGSMDEEKQDNSESREPVEESTGAAGASEKPAEKPDEASAEKPPVAESVEKPDSASAEKPEEGSGFWEHPPGNETEVEHRRRFETCLALFEKGNYEEVRNRCEALLKEEPDPVVKARIEELLGRMEIDTVAVWVAVGCFVLIGLIALFTLG